VNVCTSLFSVTTVNCLLKSHPEAENSWGRDNLISALKTIIMVGVDDLKGLFQPKQCYDSMIYLCIYLYL